MLITDKITSDVMPKAAQKGEPKQLWVKFGLRLKQKREGGGFSQKEVADAAGLHVVQLSRIENGQSGTKREPIKAMAKFIGWDIVEALGAAGLKPTPDELKEAGYTTRASDASEQLKNPIPDAELANFASRVKRLNPQQKHDFKVAWQMANDYLDKLERQNQE